MQEETDLLRLSAVECAAVEGWSPRAGGQPHRHPPACEALDLREIPLVGAVDLHDLGEQRVIAVADLRQVIPPAPQRPGEGGSVLLEVLGGQPPHGAVDHRIGEPCLEGSRDRVPHRLLEILEEPSVGDLTGEGETPDAGVVVAEADQLGPVESREPHQEPVQTRERLVAVPRDGAPDMDLA